MRWRPYSNTSQIVTAFSRDLGLVSFLARGSSRLSRRSSSFPSPFDLGGWYDVVLKRGRGELDLATESRLVEGFDHLRRDLRGYLEACFVLEVMGKMFRPRDPHPEFLRGVLSFLKLQHVGVGRLNLRIHFVGSCLRAAGLEPVWEWCTECGAELVPFSGPVQVRLPSGGVCSDCRGPKDLTFPASTFAYLVHDAQLPWGAVPEAGGDRQILGAAWALSRELLLYHLESQPRSLTFLRGEIRR